MIIKNKCYSLTMRNVNVEAEVVSKVISRYSLTMRNVNVLLGVENLLPQRVIH